MCVGVDRGDVNMNEVLSELIKAFASNPSNLMLAMVLFGMGFLAYKFVGAFEAHGTAVAATLEKISDSLKSGAEDLKELKVLSENKNK